MVPEGFWGTARADVGDEDPGPGPWPRGWCWFALQWATSVVGPSLLVPVDAGSLVREGQHLPNQELSIALDQKSYRHARVQVQNIHEGSDSIREL